MKKVFLILIIVITTFIVINKNNNKKDDNLIRIRILANSNSEYDQNIKKQVSKDVRVKMYDLLKDEKNIESARNIIKNNLDNIEQIVKNDIKNESYDYNINYGYNYFPEKEYNGKKFTEGKYESLLITLGEAKGDNWWCILFPPLCLIEAEDKKLQAEFSDQSQYVEESNDSDLAPAEPTIEDNSDLNPPKDEVTYDDNSEGVEDIPEYEIISKTTATGKVYWYKVDANGKKTRIADPNK